MSKICVNCGHGSDVGRYCPRCGVEQPRTLEPGADPFVGRVVAERYEVKELINVGGMGRVYRAVQRPLDRVVAIKFMHPHLLADEAAANRFLTEARAVSRINHPNVVSVFDFGRMPAAMGGHFFLVMEHLGGQSLAKLVRGGEPLPLRRTCRVARQILAALVEAHQIGVTHCDLKPENIVLERRRGQFDHVKVIDFGLARVPAATRHTSQGRVCGTPRYMSPEQASGRPVDPASDLYNVGLLLFEMLTGRPMFDDPSPARLLQMHVSSPRPDPREAAPGRDIPPALALVCQRALQIDPAERFPNAEAFLDAVELAAAPETSRRVGPTLFPPCEPQPMGPPTVRATPERAETVRSPVSAETPPDTLAPHEPTQPLVPRSAVRPVDTPWPLVGRSLDVAWAAEQLSLGKYVVLWGRPGTGRTRLLRHVEAELRANGPLPVLVRAPLPPNLEVGYSTLREMIARLSGEQGPDLARVAAGATADPAAIDGLRAVFADEPGALCSAPGGARSAAAAALAWAMRGALERAGARGLALLVDNADRMDGASLGALADVIAAGAVPGVAVAMTSAGAPNGALDGCVQTRRVDGLCRADVLRLLDESGLVSETIVRDDDIEPLWVEQLVQWRAEGLEDDPPSGLYELVDARIAALPPGALRTLQAVAVAGGGPIPTVAALLPDPAELDEALRVLTDALFVQVCCGSLALRHTLFGALALARCAPAVAAELHARAWDLVGCGPSRVELAAHHALRANPNFEAFLLVEETARVRSAREDEDGAIAVLRDGIDAARGVAERDSDPTALTAWCVFGRKLASALVAVGHVDEAMAAVDAVADQAGLDDAERALVLEQLAILAHTRGRRDEAERHRRLAIEAAQRCGKRALVERLERPLQRIESGTRSRVAFPRWVESTSGACGFTPRPGPYAPAPERRAGGSGIEMRDRGESAGKARQG